MAARPCLLGIAGPSCSGKTTLARFLADTLPGDNLVLSFDSYYRDFASLPPAEKAGFNFDAPQALDLELLHRHLQTLARGTGIERPVYEFATHSRATRGEWIEPDNYVIVEGLFALYWPQLRRLYRAAIFVQTDDSLCLERRLARDVAERGRTRTSVIAQYQSQVRPMCQRFVLPTRICADLVVDGAVPVGVSAAAVLVHLDSLPD